MQNVQVANQEAQLDSSADTLFGICYSIGKDFGFNPFYLRIALIALGVFSLAAAAGTYIALGLAVGLSRLFFPAAADDTAVGEAPAPAQTVERQHVEEVRERALIAA